MFLKKVYSKIINASNTAYEKIYYKNINGCRKLVEDINNSDADTLIITIAFNNSFVVEKQINDISRMCSDNYIHLVVDNSSDLKIRTVIKEICEKNENVMYFELPRWRGFKRGGSLSHGISINYVHKNVVMNCDKISEIMLLDHDIFPLKTFSVNQMLGKQNLYGRKERREGMWYLWPGFAMYRKNIFEKEMDFKPGCGGDTGGNNWKIIYKWMNESEIHCANESKLVIRETNGPVNSQKDEIEIIDDSWVHMINASDWANVGNVDLKFEYIKTMMQMSTVNSEGK